MHARYQGVQAPVQKSGSDRAYRKHSLQLIMINERDSVPKVFFPKFVPPQLKKKNTKQNENSKFHFEKILNSKLGHMKEQLNRFHFNGLTPQIKTLKTILHLIFILYDEEFEYLCLVNSHNQESYRGQAMLHDFSEVVWLEKKTR